MQRKSLNSSPFIKQKLSDQLILKCHSCMSRGRKILCRVYLLEAVFAHNICAQFNEAVFIWRLCIDEGRLQQAKYFDVFSHWGVTLGSSMHLFGPLHRSESHIFHLSEPCIPLARCGFFWLQLNKTQRFKEFYSSKVSHVWYIVLFWCTRWVFLVWEQFGFNGWGRWVVIWVILYVSFVMRLLI